MVKVLIDQSDANHHHRISTTHKMMKHTKEMMELLKRPCVHPDDLRNELAELELEMELMYELLYDEPVDSL